MRGRLPSAWLPPRDWSVWHREVVRQSKHIARAWRVSASNPHLIYLLARCPCARGEWLYVHQSMTREFELAMRDRPALAVEIGRSIVFCAEMLVRQHVDAFEGRSDPRLARSAVAIASRAS